MWSRFEHMPAVFVSTSSASLMRLMLKQMLQACVRTDSTCLLQGLSRRIKQRFAPLDPSGKWPGGIWVFSNQKSDTSVARCFKVLKMGNSCCMGEDCCFCFNFHCRYSYHMVSPSQRLRSCWCERSAPGTSSMLDTYCMRRHWQILRKNMCSEKSFEQLFFLCLNYVQCENHLESFGIIYCVKTGRRTRAKQRLGRLRTIQHIMVSTCINWFRVAWCCLGHLRDSVCGATAAFKGPEGPGTWDPVGPTRTHGDRGLRWAVRELFCQGSSAFSVSAMA